jgi:hypothetical protein
MQGWRTWQAPGGSSSGETTTHNQGQLTTVIMPALHAMRGLANGALWKTPSDSCSKAQQQRRLTCSAGTNSGHAPLSRQSAASHTHNYSNKQQLHSHRTFVPERTSSHTYHKKHMRCQLHPTISATESCSNDQHPSPAPSSAVLAAPLARPPCPGSLLPAIHTAPASSSSTAAAPARQTVPPAVPTTGNTCAASCTPASQQLTAAQHAARLPPRPDLQCWQHLMPSAPGPGSLLPATCSLLPATHTSTLASSRTTVAPTTDNKHKHSALTCSAGSTSGHAPLVQAVCCSHTHYYCSKQQIHNRRTCLPAVPPATPHNLN